MQRDSESNKVLEYCSVTVKASKNAEKIFRKGIHEIKAKTNRSKPHKVTIT